MNNELSFSQKNMVFGLPKIEKRKWVFEWCMHEKYQCHPFLKEKNKERQKNLCIYIYVYSLMSIPCHAKK